MKLDLKDLTKIDINDAKTINMVSVFFLIMVLVIDLFLFLPLIKEINNVKNMTKENIGASNYVRSLLTKKNELLTAQLVSPDSVDDLVDKIHGIAQNHNIQINTETGLGKAKGNQGESYTKRPLSMDVSGSFKNLGLFLMEIRSMPDAVVDIDSMNVLNLVPDYSKVQVQITFVVFMKDE
jgi:Tfp pilus assembly protein PilO